MNIHYFYKIWTPRQKNSLFWVLGWKVMSAAELTKPMKIQSNYERYSIDENFTEEMKMHLWDENS